MRVLPLLVLLAACASPDGPSYEVAPDSLSSQEGQLPTSEPVGSTVIVGTVVSVDLSPMAADGDAEIVVTMSNDDDVTVRVPARSNQCQADGLGLISDLQPGNTVEIIGEWLDDGGVMPCRGLGHRILRTELQTNQTVRGVFESGFETSSLRPCDAPDEEWWVGVNDSDFYDRLTAIRQQLDPEGGRGGGVLVEVAVVGDLEAGGGPYGHLGQYKKRFTVTDMQEMTFLAANPDSTVSCR